MIIGLSTLSLIERNTGLVTFSRLLFHVDILWQDSTPPIDPVHLREDFTYNYLKKTIITEEITSEISIERNT